MKRRIEVAVLAIAVAAVSPCLMADDLTGANVLLCTAVQATLCLADEDCEMGVPWQWNIPQFIEVDLAGKILRTTKASGENRSTPIKNLQREDGMVFLQGVERGRAFSFAIEEETGFLSAVVASSGKTVSVFGACTVLGGVQ